MTLRPAKLSLALLGFLSVTAAAACSSGASSASGPTTTLFTGTARTATTLAAASTTVTTGAASCQLTTAATGASGGGDVLVPGDIPDGVHYVTYHGTAYHVDHPEGWAQQVEGTTVTFTDKFNSIRVETTPEPAAPSVATAQADDVAALRTSAPCFVVGKVREVTRPAGAAVLINYRAASPADPVTGKVVLQDVERYLFWQAGTRATITLSSPKGSDNVDPWRKVTNSFGWGA
jgi:hypothetical protein